MENHDAEPRKMGEAFEEVSRQLAAANERAGRLEETMERLIVWANDSVDMKYGTLSADMVRKMCEKALEVPDAS